MSMKRHELFQPVKEKATAGTYQSILSSNAVILPSKLVQLA